MGAVALVGLLAGGPLGLCLALAYGVVTVMKIAKVDSQYAARGETPPSYRLVEKWLDGRKARGQAPADARPARFGMWRYAAQRWFAMWELMGDDHQARYAAEKNARAEAREKGLPIPKRASLRERLAGLRAWRWTLDTLVAPVGEKAATAEPVNAGQAPTEPAGEPAPTAPAPADGPRIACQDCGQSLRHVGDQWEHPSSAGCPAVPGTPEQDPTPTEQTTIPATAEDTAPIEGDNMTTTQQTGEVTGIRSAIAYAEAMASAHASHGGNEGFVGSLHTMEVGQGDIAKVQAAMEASMNAAAQWAGAAASIKQNNSAVSEAYASSPDAGNKQAQVNE